MQRDFEPTSATEQAKSNIRNKRFLTITSDHGRRRTWSKGRTKSLKSACVDDLTKAHKKLFTPNVLLTTYSVLKNIFSSPTWEAIDLGC